MDKDTGNTESADYNPSDNDKESSNGDARAMVISDIAPFVESIVKAFLMTEDEDYEVRFENCQTFPTIYEPLHFTAMKAALTISTISPACRDTIITVLFRQHLKDERLKYRANAWGAMRGPDLWKRLSTQDQYKMISEEGLPPMNPSKISEQAALWVTDHGGASGPTLTPHGLAIHQMNAASDLAADLHRDAPPSLYANLSEVPDEIFEGVPPQAEDQIRVSWKSIHDAHHDGLDADAKQRCFDLELELRLRTCQNWSK